MTEKKPFFGSQTSKWLLAGAAILTIGVGVGVADWARGRDHGYGPGWRGPDRQARMQHMCERDPLRFEGVARAFLKADLDLKPEQNAELDKLAAVLVPALKEVRDEVCNNFAAAGNATAPVKVERLAAALRKAADAAEKVVPPTKSFYAALDDKQKARVDELSERRSRRGPHMMGPGMMGPGGPHGPGMDSGMWQRP